MGENVIWQIIFMEKFMKSIMKKNYNYFRSSCFRIP